MMNESEFDALIRMAGTPEYGEKYLRRVRSSPPSRRPQNRGGNNVTGFYPSRKMGFTINFESHRNELAAIYLHEHNPDIAEYYDQPEPINLTYPCLSGKNVGFSHTPDFLVIRRNGAVLQEWKEEGQLLDLAKTMPNRYLRNDDGTWCCPPGEAAAKELGLAYEVHSSTELDRCFLRNMVYLEDYFRGDPEPTPEDAGERVRGILKNCPAITLAELTAEAESVSVDQINLMIALGEVYVDLSATSLVNKDQVRVFGSRGIADAYVAVNAEVPSVEYAATSPIHVFPGSSVLWDGRPLKVKLIGNSNYGFLDEHGHFVELAKDVVERMLADGELAPVVSLDKEHDSAKSNAIKLLLQADDDDLAEATRRWFAISPYTDISIPESPEIVAGKSYSLRSCRRWKADYQKAKWAHGIGYLGLLPKPNPGNSEEKISAAANDAIEEFIATEYENIRNQKKSVVYGAIRNFCEKQGIRCPCRKTLAKKIKLRPQHAQTLARAGKREAYRKEFFWEIDANTPRHGDRVFEIGHVDHTQLDIEVVCPETRRNLGRPWLTILIDAYSRKILAVHVTFDPPSYRSCLMVFRICVMRHHRLPRIIVVDGGKDFQSTYFDSLLARYECTKKVRPGAKPRFGSICERIFGTTNTQFVHNLLGNTQLMKDPRTVTKAVNPKNLAVWTLDRIYVRLCEFSYEVYETNDHPALHQSPRDAAAASLASDGERSHIYIAYDEIFKIMTLPTTSAGRAMVQPGYGVKINHTYYSCVEFRDPRFQKTSVPVRYDPFDYGTAYAFVDGRWTRCISELRHLFLGRSEREIMLITEKLRQKNKLHHSKSIDVTASKIAAHIAECHADEDILLQQGRDAQNQKVLAIVYGEALSDTNSQLEIGSTPPANGSSTPNESESVPVPASLEELEGYQE